MPARRYSVDVVDSMDAVDQFDVAIGRYDWAILRLARCLFPLPCLYNS